jgi:DNA/RNA-binding protein KIN17
MAAIMMEETQRKAKAAAAAAAAAAATAAAAAAKAGQGSEPRGHSAWLCPGLVVKVLNKALGGGRYHKQKGVIKALISPFVAQLEMLASGDVLSLDQDDLQTVLPPLGGPLRILTGTHRGARAQLRSIDEASYSVTVELADGPSKGAAVDGLEYEDVCKLHVRA